MTTDPGGDRAPAGGRPRRGVDTMAFALASASLLPSGWLIGRVIREIYVFAPVSDPQGVIRWLASRIFEAARRRTDEPLVPVFFAATGWSLALAVMALWIVSAAPRSGTRMAGSVRRFATGGLVLTGLGLATLAILSALHFYG